MPDPEDVVERLNDLVEPSDELGNEVLPDDSRVVRWAGPLFSLFSVLLLPWIVYIGLSLPSRQLSPNYDIAWAGFDTMLFGALAATAYFTLRRSRYLATAAAAAAALLIVDSWFDVMTTPAKERLQSIMLAAFVELPLAAVCLWLSYHTQQLEERRIELLLHRPPGGAGKRWPGGAASRRSRPGPG